MLNYATIVMSNPGKPTLAMVSVKALVISDDVGLIVPPPLMQLLQAETKDTRQIQTSAGPQAVPYAGPFKLEYQGRAAFAGGTVHGGEVIVGGALAAELGLVKASVPVIAATSVMTPAKPLTDAHSQFPTVPTKEGPNAGRKILMVENFIDEATCRSLCEYMKKQKMTPLGVVDHDKTTTGQVVSKIDTKSRDTMLAPVDGVEDQLNQILCKAFVDHVEPYYGLEIDRWERPQMLYYTTGGKYGVHADAENWVKQPDGTGIWKKSQDRDISVLLYLNDEFTGGLLDFPNQKMKLKPKPGLFVAFPSTNEYKHGAEPTESGERMVVVSWAAAKGVPRVLEKIPYKTAMMSDYRKTA